MTPEQLERLSEAERNAYYATLSFEELLELASECATRLAQQVDSIPGLILDGMEKKLETHGPSKAEATKLLDRLTGAR
ncbi:hypothetical protein F6X40_24240 [Paraburkholderia sp. UCT31]|uniref:hypothetical protein n=1 Tax=Paraburkholderia sp. UCT31 TaxID=2615209 RepID=UPI0016567392|nr:hypothetical protein [Paraburkholderia sp. UCT31]MBC8739827.1 hypothetical protein [Paraburkholderia sp. UCT31]